MHCFRSKAGADVLMLGRHADLVLRALGREPAPEGIFLAEQIEAALAAFAARQPDALETGESDGEGEPPREDEPDLARRAWPLLDLLLRAQRAGQPVTWSSS